MSTIQIGSRCDCGYTTARPTTQCPGCGQPAARPELIVRLPSRIDSNLPHTSALITAALASGGHDG